MQFAPHSTPRKFLYLGGGAVIWNWLAMHISSVTVLLWARARKCPIGLLLGSQTSLQRSIYAGPSQPISKLMPR